jgi:ankyrin repeat protein
MNTKKQETASPVAKDKVLEFIRAASEGNSRRVRAFLNGGVNVNAAYQGNAKASTNALIGAVRNGHTKVVRLLLEHGANPSFRAATIEKWRTQFEVDALGLAAEKGHLEIVRLLINAGANVNESINCNLDALNAAVVEGHVKIVRELLNAGYLIKGPGGKKALDAAISRNRRRVALLLIQAGVDVRSDREGLLLAAALKGMVLVVKAMLKAGADPKAKLFTGKSTLQSFKFIRKHKDDCEDIDKDAKVADEVQQLLEHAAGRK